MNKQISAEVPQSVHALQDASQSFVHLDMLRAVASLLVMFGHLRSFVFVSYDQLASHNLLNVLVWSATGFGHQSVMIFFVLSGFFITRSIVLDDRKYGFRWPVYGIKRLSRLWMVLIPALVLTALCDNLGLALNGERFYSGLLYSLYISGPAVETGGAHLEASTFLGNLFFLQTVVSPIFGSNGPLWSLANEFWYYFLFPLLYIAATRRALTSIVALVVFAVVCEFLGRSMMMGGLVWLMGAGAYFVYDQRWLRRWRSLRFAPVVGAILVLASLVLSKSSFGSDFTKDCLIGAATAVLVVILAEFKVAGRTYSLIAGITADASYTIYLVHFPFLALLANVVLGYQKFDASLAGYAAFVSLAAVCLAYCYLIYWLFERHTGSVRRYCLSKFSRYAAGQRAG